MIIDLSNLTLENCVYIYLGMFVFTLLLNAFISGLCKHRMTFRDYLDSFLFPVTYIYIIGLTVAGIGHSLHDRYVNTKAQIKLIKEKEALSKLEKESKNDKS